MTIQAFTPRGLPSTSVTPRSYTDGVTYLEEFHDLIAHVNRQLEKMDAVLASIPEQISDAINAHDRDLTEQIRDLSLKIDRDQAETKNELAVMLDRVNAAVYNIQNSTIEVSDPVMNGVISDENTATYATIVDIVAGLV